MLKSQIAAKLLQIATWLLLTANRNLPTPIQQYNNEPPTMYCCLLYTSDAADE